MVQEPPTHKPGSTTSAEDDSWSFTVGVGATVVACVCSSVASVYLEKILIESKPSIWVRNVQLCLFTIPIAFSGTQPTNLRSTESNLEHPEPNLKGAPCGLRVNPNMNKANLPIALT